MHKMYALKSSSTSEITINCYAIFRENTSVTLLVCLGKLSFFLNTTSLILSHFQGTLKAE